MNKFLDRRHPVGSLSQQGCWRSRVMYPNNTLHLSKPNLLAAHQEQKKRQQQLQARVRQEAARLAAILVQEFGAQTVYAVGPLTYNQFTEGMPLELAVEGMPAEGLARALAHLKQISTLQVELTAVQQLDSWTSQALRRTGIVLAEAIMPVHSLRW